MTQTIKKYLALCLALCMLATLFAGCQKPADPVTPDVTIGTPTDPVKEPITMKIIGKGSEMPDNSTETVIGKIIKEKFNITFEFILQPTNYDEQCGIWLAGGDYPEVMRLSSNTLMQQYIDADAVLCLEDYLENMPNFTEKRASQIPYWRSHALDNKLYKWESGSPESPDGQRDDFDVMVRTDFLEQQGWPETISASQYLDFMKKAVAENPKTDDKSTLGLTFAGAESWGVTMPFVMAEKGDQYFHLNMIVNGDIKNNVFANKWLLPETKESAKFFNDAYLAGLLDKESYSLTDPDCLAKMTTGQPALYFYARWNTAPANAGLMKAGLDERQYIELPIQLDSQVGQKRQLVQQLVRPFENLIMTKNCKNPDRFLELLDWWQTDEAQLLGGSGVEGTDYEVKDGKRVPLAPLSEYLKGNDMSWPTKTGTYESGLFAASLGYRCDNYAKDNQPFRITKDPTIRSEYGLTERQKEAYTALGWENSKSWYEKNGDIHFDGLMKGIGIDPASDLGKDMVKITELSSQYSSKLVFAASEAEFEKIYTEMLNEINKFNPDAITAEYNRLLEAAKANIK